MTLNRIRQLETTKDGSAFLNRLALCWNILKGNPTMFRIKMNVPFGDYDFLNHGEFEGLHAANCVFTTKPTV